jgi:hypothetical protein
MKLWATNFVALNCADIALTLMLTEKWHREGNPVWALALTQGWLYFAVLKVLVSLLFVGLLLRARASRVLEGATVGMMLVVLWNATLVLFN